jgi:hypothetical protein
MVVFQPHESGDSSKEWDMFRERAPIKWLVEYFKYDVLKRWP